MFSHYNCKALGSYHDIRKLKISNCSIAYFDIDFDVYEVGHFLF